MRASRKLSVALACPEGPWPHPDWPDSDDPYVGRVVRLRPPSPFRVPDGVDVVVLHCVDPVDRLRELRADGVPVIVVAPRRDDETVMEVLRGGAGYLVEGDYCTRMLSSAVVGATVGHPHLSPAACTVLREGTLRVSADDAATERLRGLLSRRERQIMELLSTGLGAQEIGLRLTLSEKTVRNNLSNIYAKLDARGSTDAVLRWLGAAPVLRV
ncbi:LuxR C-terminal-related transcriptional regulator [Streptomyces sp. NPDC056373]|uniref:LuxR C-terminal-related transcriptional regulator n=1 Tax=Streptomyces sp. NPDC056373 TaxID=3345798 RepID=UPI0035D7192D